MENKSRVIRRKSSALSITRKPAKAHTHAEALAMVRMLCSTGENVSASTLLQILQGTEDFGYNPVGHRAPQALTVRRRKIGGVSRGADVTGGLPTSPHTSAQRGTVVNCIVTGEFSSDPLTMDRIATVNYEFRVPERYNVDGEDDAGFVASRVAQELLDQTMRRAAPLIQEAANNRNVEVVYAKPVFRSTFPIRATTSSDLTD